MIPDGDVVKPLKGVDDGVNPCLPADDLGKLDVAAVEKPWYVSHHLDDEVMLHMAELQGYCVGMGLHHKRQQLVAVAGNDKDQHEVVNDILVGA